MTTFAQISITDAIAVWLVDAPPIAHPCPEPVAMTAIQIGESGAWPTATLNGTANEIVGVTSSGWLSIAGAGWHKFLGDWSDFARIAAACTAMQIGILSNKAWFEGCMRRIGQRSDLAKIGGLAIIETEDGRRWIRLDDITRIEVRDAFHRHLSANSRADMQRICYNFGTHKMDTTFADADVWWRFARTWPEQSPDIRSP